MPALIALFFLISAGPGSGAIVRPASTSPAQEQGPIASTPRALPPSTALPVPAPPPAAAPETPSVPAPMPPSVPVRLRIPAIDLDSGLVELGLDQDGTLQVPQGAHPAGWYDGSPTPGSLGPAIISGHVDYGGETGVFYDLRAVAVDDQVAVERLDGSTAVFQVTRVAQFPKGEFPSTDVYGDLDHVGLRLITCGGSFDRQARSYVDNIVVFAELVFGELVAPMDPMPAHGTPSKISS